VLGSAALGAPGAIRLRLADLVGEHPDVERAGGFVLVYVLTIGLVTLHEVAWRAPEAAPAAQTDLNRLRHDITGELTALSSTHALSSDVLD